MSGDGLPPRVLVVSETVPATGTGGGVVLYRMLRDYPPDRLLVVGPEARFVGDRLPCRYEPIGRARSRLYSSRLSRAMHTADALGLLPHVPAAVAARLRGFRPDVVMSVMEGYLYRTAHAFARRAGLPLGLVVHDRPDLLASVPPWAAAARHRLDAAAYRYAAARWCVSPEMAEHGRAHYGVGGDVLYPMRSGALRPRPPVEAAVLREAGVLRLGFAGSLGLGYGEQLIALLPVLRSAGARLYLHGRPGSGSDALRQAGADVVVDCGFARTPEEAWDRIKRDCDAVILPYRLSPGPALSAMYATHFPSKLTEYVALGMPIVMTGPAHATGVRWANRNPGSALLACDARPESVRDVLLDLKASPERRVAAARAALAAGADFEPTAIAARLASSLRAIAARPVEPGI